MNKKPETWKRLNRRVALEHPRLRIIEDEIELPDGTTSTYIRQAPTTSHSVIIIAINDKNEILLQREYSYPPNEIMWQLPGGSINISEDVLDAARRELSEESDLSAKDSRLLDWYYTANHFSNQKQYIVLCTNLYPNILEGDKEEFIETHWITIDKIRQMITSGEFHNINLLAALNVWLHKK